ncbi:hypothetical protein [Pseudonocardia sp. MH-G8]|uniref:hypothetical protein n=1 Tax=Pseudonocardia sp. MH-G8 TaxID=1854588 RepID=UPI000BA12921|nr:hypothetical protein [Pseudonocardia sp. MH-G8]OZM80012.1 hypothetical protein CFP66_23765 [Pseudonocardia sp. MH-G8]
MLITFVSAKNSPGVTTATLALAAEWPREAFVVDADPSGGDIAAGLGRGSWPPGSTVLELVVQARHEPVGHLLQRMAVRVDHGPAVLGGLGRPGQAAAVPWAQLSGAFRALGDIDVLCDGGRFLASGGITPLLQASHHVVVVTGSTLPAARSAARLTALLREEVLPSAAALGLLVVGAGRPYSAGDIATACQVPLLGQLPLDPRAARVWAEGREPGPGFRRSALQREARRIALAAPPAQAAS